MTNLTMTLEAREHQQGGASVSGMFADGQELGDYKV